MRIEIDIDKIVQNIDINKLVEENILSNMLEAIDVDSLVDEILENEEAKSLFNKKITNIINEYISSDEGKRYIIDIFNDKISDSDILTDEKVTDLLAEFLKKKLKIRSSDD